MPAEVQLSEVRASVPPMKNLVLGITPAFLKPSEKSMECLQGNTRIYTDILSNKRDFSFNRKISSYYAIKAAGFTDSLLLF